MRRSPAEAGRSGGRGFDGDAACGDTSEAEAKQLLAAAGIASAPERLARRRMRLSPRRERFGFPMVMKILSPDILHKSEIGGVLLDISDADAVRSGFALLLRRANGGTGCSDLGRTGSKTIAGRRGVHSGHPPRSGVRPDGDVRPGRDFRRNPEGRRVPPLPVRSRHRRDDDPFDQGRAFAVGRARAEAGGCKGVGGDAIAVSAFAVAAGERLQSIDLNPVFAMPEGRGRFRCRCGDRDRGWGLAFIGAD